MTDSLTANPDNQAQEIASSKEKKKCFTLSFTSVRTR